MSTMEYDSVFKKNKILIHIKKRLGWNSRKLWVEKYTQVYILCNSSYRKQKAMSSCQRGWELDPVTKGKKNRNSVVVKLSYPDCNTGLQFCKIFLLGKSWWKIQISLQYLLQLYVNLQLYWNGILNLEIILKCQDKIQKEKSYLIEKV